MLIHTVQSFRPVTRFVTAARVLRSAYQYRRAVYIGFSRKEVLLSMFRRSISALIFTMTMAICAARPGVCGSTPTFDDTMPLKQVRPGMTGYGLTVFRGTTIEKFSVTVVDVVKDGNLLIPGHDAILVRMSGGPMTTRQANLIQGMSGSPIYINGKLIGAFSQGESNVREPLGLVTPIEDMLEAWDPKLPTTIASRPLAKQIQAARLEHPLRISGRRIETIVCNAPIHYGLPSTDRRAVFHPCTTYLSMSSASRAAREKLAKALEPYNVEIMQGGIGGGQLTGFKGAPLVPGAAFGMMLTTGDMAQGATGTITYRRGNRVLGFGHPLLGIGPIEAPITSAYVYDVLPRITVSHKIASPGPVVGYSTQDRNFSVSAVLGRMPKTIPITVDVRDATTGRQRVFHAQSVAHQNLYAALVSVSVSSAIAEIHSTPGPAMARVETTIDAGDLGKITRTNLVYDSRGIDGGATADLDDLLGILSANPFTPIVIKSADVKVEIESAHHTAQIDRIFLKEGRFEPGETAEVGVVIKPYKEAPITRTMKVAIPSNTPNGRYLLQVRGGAVPGGVSFGGMTLRLPQPQNAEQAPPVNLKQMIARYGEREKNNEIVARLILPTTAINVEGERLSSLPPPFDAILRSAKSSVVRLERDEVKVVQPVDWVISGQQVLSINVQKRDSIEPPSGSSGSQPPPGASPASPSGPGVAASAQSRDPDEEEATETQLVFSEGQKPAPRTPAPSKKNARPSVGADGAVVEPGSETAQKAPAGPAQTVESASAEKPVGRAPHVWRQYGAQGLSAGTFHGTGVSSKGDLRLVRSVHKIAATGESFVWCLISDRNGGLYAGTGTRGGIYRIRAGANPELFVRLAEVSVHSLLLAHDGSLWAGTGPRGRVYKIDPNGKADMVYKGGEQYILALVEDSRGNVYIATGAKGSIYRASPEGKVAPFFVSQQDHILALAVDTKDNIYAGTASSGLVYKIRPDGTATAVYDAPEASITGLAVDKSGIVYASTAPKGVIYRLDPDGTSKVWFDKAASAITALRLASDGTLYACSGNSIWTVKSDGTAIAFQIAEDVDMISLAEAGDGAVYAGTGNGAELYVGERPTGPVRGEYESVVHDAKQRAHWGALRWVAAKPVGGGFEFQTRSGDVSEPDATWTPWSAPSPDGDGAKITSRDARYIQYRLALSSTSADNSPNVREVQITYLPMNQAPRISFQSPMGGERWSRRQTIRWEASDVDKDALSFEVYYSSDGGAKWLPLPTSAASTRNVPTPAASSSATHSSAPDNGHRPPSSAEVTAELDKHPDLPAALREEIIARAKAVESEFLAGGASTSTAHEVAPPTRETSSLFDTQALPDGTYTLKVVASDRPSNPSSPQTAVAISEPFMVCNRAPTVVVYRDGIKIQSNGVVTLEGVAVQRGIAVTAVQFRVDLGEWFAAVPGDGIFDGGLEAFSASTQPLAKGPHTIEVKAFNAALVTRLEKVSVEIK